MCVTVLARAELPALCNSNRGRAWARRALRTDNATKRQKFNKIVTHLLPTCYEVLLGAHFTPEAKKSCRDLPKLASFDHLRFRRFRHTLCLVVSRCVSLCRVTSRYADHLAKEMVGAVGFEPT